MSRKNFMAAAAACILAAACSSAPTLRGAASDLPDRFVVRDASGGTRPVAPDPACENPLIDPRDGMELRLVRASAGFGDYAPDAARYGLSRYELLRVDCATGAGVGRYTR